MTCFSLYRFFLYPISYFIFDTTIASPPSIPTPTYTFANSIREDICNSVACSLNAVPTHFSLRSSTGRLMHLYAVCVDCLEGVHKIVCIKCKSLWDGSWHQLGTMYTYDILAATPCCQVDFQRFMVCVCVCADSCVCRC